MPKKYIPIVWTTVVALIIWWLVLFNVQKTEAPSKELAWSGETETGTTFTTWKKETDKKTAEENQNLWEKFSAGEKINIKCELETEQEWWKVKQMVYISSPKIRMDMNVANKAWNSESHMIMDSEYTYIWGSHWPAMKMKNIKDTEEKDEEPLPNPQEQEKDMKGNLEQIPYNKCVEWIVDDSMFELPTWTEFMNMEDMMKNMPSQADMEKMMKQAWQ